MCGKLTFYLLRNNMYTIGISRNRYEQINYIMSITQYTHQELSMVWNKGFIVQGYNSSEYRKDAYGTWIAWAQYGDRNAEFGWEVDHIIPLSKNGAHHIDNVRPLHWKNNAAKSDKLL